MIRKISFSLLFLIGELVSIFAQQGSLSGKITDAETGEDLIGTTIVIQGTTKGTITDFEGNYLLDNISPGSYNIVISFISYDQQIIQVKITGGETTVLNTALKQATIGLDEVVIKKVRRTDTEMSLLSSLKSSNLIVSGISSQQISKSLDKDAAEVIRRVPGITITSGKFVIVRGLVDRYNSVLLNGVSAPSFEADKRAFSFDAVPSGMIDNILIYKSPAPELPADFAGAAINIVTKSNADQNSFKVGYSFGYSENATFNKDFQTYEGGKYDWLGIDDGTRALPDNLPSTDKIKELYKWPDLETYYRRTDSITALSKSFNTIWNNTSTTPVPDQSLNFSLQKRFILGKMSMGNITAFNYKVSSSYYNLTRREYYDYDAERDSLLPNFDFTDNNSKMAAEIGFIHNWLLVFGKNQKIEFRNFLNNLGEKTTIQRHGNDYYDVRTINATNLRYNQRLVYSGQLAGTHKIINEKTGLDWVVGYTFTKNNKPDDRRLYYVLDRNSDTYYLELQNQPTNVKNAGRLYIDLSEKIYNAGLNITQDFNLFQTKKSWQIKTGLYYEHKYRDYNMRLLGVIQPRPIQTVSLFQPVENIITEENFFFDQTNPRRAGLAYGDGSKAKNSYVALSNLFAGYIALKIPVVNKVDIYGGIRLERFYRNLNGFYEEGQNNEDLKDVTRDTLNIFPSANITYTINEKHLLRLSYGKTINRPEIREISISDYEDFDLNAIVHGNPDLKSAFIDNYDLRYEWYPNLGEMISFALFYKNFTNPIELFQIYAGTGYDYKPYNTEKAYSTGAEIDIRKELSFFENSQGIIRYLKDITIICNASFIKSEITTDKAFARERKRIMQGQSPYIINAGLFYNLTDKGLMVNMMYNRVGKRINYTGTPDNPHTWELPRNSFDITVNKTLWKRFEFRIGVKDLFNEPVRLVQYYGSGDNVTADTHRYIPNRKFTIGLNVKLY